MKFRPLPALFLSALLLGFASCLKGAGPAVDDKSEKDSAIPVPLAAIPPEEAWADSVLEEMTMEEMVGQLVMPAIYSSADKASLRQLSVYSGDLHVGGVVLLKGSSRAARAISDTLAKISKIVPFVAIDAEWGLAMRLEDTPGYPRNGRISGRAERELLYDYGYEVARESRESGVNMVLGPVLDVVPSVGRGAGGVIGSRSFGSDPRRAALLGCAYARGLEDGGVVSIAKHFPGHGSADADSHKRLPMVGKSLQSLEMEDLLPFEEYISHDLSGLMTAHIHAPALDSIFRPVSVSPAVLKDIIRKKLGFTGLILTDAMNMKGVGGYSGADALIAGADIVLAPTDTKKEIEKIRQAVIEGNLPVNELKDKTRRVLKFKFLFLIKEEFRRKADLSEAEMIRKKLLE